MGDVRTARIFFGSEINRRIVKRSVDGAFRSEFVTMGEGVDDSTALVIFDNLVEEWGAGACLFG